MLSSQVVTEEISFAYVLCSVRFPAGGAASDHGLMAADGAGWERDSSACC